MPTFRAMPPAVCIPAGSEERTYTTPTWTEGGFMVTEEEWHKARALADEFYRIVPDGTIDDYNDALRYKYRLEAEENAKYASGNFVPEPKVPVSGYVYLLSGGGYHKIGMSKNPDKRAKSVASGVPFPVTKMHDFPCDDAEAGENCLHHRYRKHRKRGEWFKLPPIAVLFICSITEYRCNDLYVEGQRYE